MTDSCRHFSDLPVFAFHQLHGQPTGGNRFAEANRRFARGQLRLRLNDPGDARQSFFALNEQPVLHSPEGIAAWDPLDLRVILALVSMARMKQSFVQLWFVAQQQKPLGIRIQPAYGINLLPKIELPERAISRSVFG